MNQLPGGETIHRMRFGSDKTMTYREIGDRYGVSRQAAYKMHKRWAEKQGVDIRTRPVRNVTEEN